VYANNMSKYRFFEFNLTSSELNYRYKFFALFQIHCFRKQLCHLFVHRYGIVEFNVPLQLVCAVSFVSVN